jgi:hypothetical protein
MRITYRQEDTTVSQKILSKLLIFSTLILCLSLLLPLHAQAGALVAFINSSGQLVVASADGSVRWIVTNPGELLQPELGYTWSPAGDKLFFAVQTSGGISLRIGDVGTQTASEIGLASGSVSGGDWTDRGIVIANDNTLRFYQTNGSVTSIDRGAAVQVISPYTAGKSGVRDDAVLFAQADSFHLLRGDDRVLDLPGSQTALGLSSALWSDEAALVAYSAFNEQNNSILVVASHEGGSISLSSGRSTPLTPVLWLPGTTQLLYYGADYQIQLAEVGCVFNGCGANPLENGTVVLPASAVDVRIAQNTVFFRESEQIRGVRLACVATNTCLNEAFTLGGNAVTDAGLTLQGTVLVYTAYSQDAFNPNDRTIWRVDVACVPECAAQPLLAGAVNGWLSPAGDMLIADIAGAGLHLMTLSDAVPMMLSGSGAALSAARWNG